MAVENMYDCINIANIPKIKFTNIVTFKEGFKKFKIPFLCFIIKQIIKSKEYIKAQVQNLKIGVVVSWMYDSLNKYVSITWMVNVDIKMEVYVIKTAIIQFLLFCLKIKSIDKYNVMILIK